jgi:hypothetical protein
MKDGAFSPDVYQNALRLSRLSVSGYETNKREELLIRKMTKLIETAAVIPDAGLDNISADENTKKMIKDSLAKDAKDKVVRSYVEGMKKKLNVKVNRELL